MSETRPLFLGPRLRRLRREMGLTQAAMAEDLGISPSYVALIEHNQRPVTADLLLRIARGYRLDLGELAGDDGADTARRLTELLRDPVFAEIDLPALEVADLAASFPGASEALVRLYGAYTRAQAALAEAGSGGDAAPEPVTEARRFIASRRNFFASLDARAEALAEAVTEAGDGTAYLARVVGEKKAREIWYLCRRYSAAEALAMGLVNCVVPHDQLDAEVAKWCAEIMERSPTAIAIAKRSFNADSANIAGIGGMGMQALSMYYASDESKEGVNAFNEKRKPDFRKHQM